MLGVRGRVVVRVRETFVLLNSADSGTFRQFTLSLLHLNVFICSVCLPEGTHNWYLRCLSFIE